MVNFQIISRLPHTLFLSFKYQIRNNRYAKDYEHFIKLNYIISFLAHTSRFVGILQQLAQKTNQVAGCIHISYQKSKLLLADFKNSNLKQRGTKGMQCAKKFTLNN